MKKIQYKIAIVCALLLSSCNLFDPYQLEELSPQDDLNEEKIFSEYGLFRQYADHTYSYMPGHIGRMWNALVSSMSDESRSNGCTTIFNTGAWNGNISTDAKSELNNMWKNMYFGIRKANKIIENINKVQDFPSDEVKNRYLGEAYFLRAYFHYELIRRWGGVPIVDHTLKLGEENIDLPRDTYEKCVEFIVADCERAKSLLSLKYADADNGRATIGAAMALKSRVLLYAARPLHNPDNDVEKWQAAARAAKDVIDLNQYSLYPDYVNMFFQPVCDEIIMNRPRQKMNFEQGHTSGTGGQGSIWVRFMAPQGYQGWSGDWVTQNMVDKFEDKDGYPIDQSTIYDEQNPYENRDPRLDMCVLRNDRYWYNRNLEFWVTENGAAGRDKGTTHVNVLGYAIAKFWPESHQRYQGTSTYLNYIFFRYAEILLNFAEAQNEVGGPESKLDELSVRDALNELRDRVGHAAIPADISNTTASMRERIKNERAVELCFEEHRWYDVISWNEGTVEFTKDIYGIRIVKQTDGTFIYERQFYQKPKFEEHMHLYPIPDDEVFKSENLKQNPGWN